MISPGGATSRAKGRPQAMPLNAPTNHFLAVHLGTVLGVKSSRRSSPPGVVFRGDFRMVPRFLGAARSLGCADELRPGVGQRCGGRSISRSVREPAFGRGGDGRRSSVVGQDGRAMEGAVAAHGTTENESIEAPGAGRALGACAQCGEVLRHARRTYCGSGCAAAARRVPRSPCPACGEPAPRSDRRFCGAACWHAWRATHRQDGYWRGTRRPELSGPAHPSWKGEAASESAKRARARRRYPRPQLCICCRLEYGVRTFRDGDAGNLDRRNIVWQCRGCLARHRWIRQTWGSRKRG